MIRRIQVGAYAPGSRVSSPLELAQEFGVVNATAAKAMRYVREEGWTRGEVGLGTFVADPLPSVGPPKTTNPPADIPRAPNPAAGFRRGTRTPPISSFRPIPAPLSDLARKVVEIEGGVIIRDR